MAQTPKSVSVNILGNSSTNIYTVPAATTAIVKGVIAAPIQGSGGLAFDVSKTSSGIVYPITQSRTNSYTAATGATNNPNINLIEAPITMAAGESITLFCGTNSQYRLPNVSTFGNTALTGTTPQIRKIIYANSIYMAVGTYSTPALAFVATSSDGITWTEQTGSQNFPTLVDVAFISTGSIWVGVASKAVIYSTNNGVTWTAATSLPDTNTIAAVIASSTTALIATANSTYWSSTNGSTWTALSSTVCPAVNQTGVTGFTFSNNYFVLSNYNSTCVSTDLTNWSFLGSSQNYTYGTSNSTWQGIAYSPAYTRNFMGRSDPSLADKQFSTSTVGSPNLASACTSPTNGFNSGTLEAAGSNTIIIANNNVGSTTKWKSTNGSSFAVYTDSRSFTGQVVGLANGQFYTYQSLTSTNYYISTDPSTLTGTLVSSGNTITDVSCGAADPVSGAYILWSYNSSSTLLWSQAAITATGAGTLGTNVIDPGTYGGVTDCVWDATLSRFWALTTTGNIFWATAANAVAGSWTTFSNVSGTAATGPFSNSQNTANTLDIIGSTIYVTSSNSAGSIYIGNTGNSSLWITQSVGSSYYQAVIQNRTNYAGRRYSGQQWSATNGTNITYMNYNSAFAILTPSINKYAMGNVPAGVGTVQTLNGNQFAYGGYYGGDIAGFLTGSDLITGLGNFYSTGGGQVTSSNVPSLYKAAYVGSTYYIYSENATLMYSGTSLTNIINSFAVSSSTVAGVQSIQPIKVVNGDGGLSTYKSNDTLQMSRTTVAPILGVASVTASVVEIT